MKKLVITAHVFLSLTFGFSNQSRAQNILTNEGQYEKLPHTFGCPGVDVIKKSAFDRVYYVENNPSPIIWTHRGNGDIKNVSTFISMTAAYEDYAGKYLFECTYDAGNQQNVTFQTSHLLDYINRNNIKEKNLLNWTKNPQEQGPFHKYTCTKSIDECVFQKISHQNEQIKEVMCPLPVTLLRAASEARNGNYSAKSEISTTLVDRVFIWKLENEHSGQDIDPKSFDFLQASAYTNNNGINETAYKCAYGGSDKLIKFTYVTQLVYHGLPLSVKHKENWSDQVCKSEDTEKCTINR